MSIGRLRTCFGSTLAFYQIRDENLAKFKISYSCGYRVSKSASSDAGINDVDAEHEASLFFSIYVVDEPSLTQKVNIEFSSDCVEAPSFLRLDP